MNGSKMQGMRRRCEGCGAGAAQVLRWLSLILAAGLAGCGGADDDAGSGAIVVRGLHDMTGPTAEIGTPYAYGVIDALDDLNEQGGIRGRLVEHEWVEFAYDTARALEIYRGWRASAEWSRVVTVFGWGTGDSLALRGEAAQDRVPLITASYAGSLSSPAPVQRTVLVPNGSAFMVDNPGAPYNFFAGTDYSTSIRIALQFVQGNGGKKIALLHCSASYCLDPIPAGRSYAAAIGLSVASEQLDTARPDGQQRLELTDLESEIDRKVADYFAVPDNKDIDWAWIGNTRNTTNYIARAVRKHAPQVKIIVNVWGFDELSGTQCGPECAEQVYGLLPFAAYGDTRFPGMFEVLALHDRRRQARGESLDLHRNVRYVQGYVSALMWRAAVEQLLDRRERVTGENIKAALERFDALETGGLTSPLHFSPDDHRPASGARIYSIDGNGKLRFESETIMQLQEDWLGW
jgi:branched-chain amino acid transport system substrate-binding protein